MFSLQASAVQSDPAYLKGYYRRAAAQMSLGKFKKALSDFEYVSSDSGFVQKFNNFEDIFDCSC